MKKTFWLLDVNHEVKDHRPEMWIWGICMHYVSNQVVPAASRILSMFGVTKEELLPSKTPRTLLEFMED